MNRTLAPGSLSAESAPVRGNALTRRLAPYLDRATVLGILLLVVLVTLPRLRSMAIQENELDAMRTLGVLGGEVFAAEKASPERLGQLFEGESALDRRLADTRVTADGRLLERYGYLFELVESEDGPCLRAWPVEEGRTGQGAFWLDADLGLRGDANQGSQWSGLEKPPTPSDARTWNALELPGSRREGI